MYNTVGVRYRVARVCQRQRRLVLLLPVLKCTATILFWSSNYVSNLPPYLCVYVCTNCNSTSADGLQSIARWQHQSCNSRLPRPRIVERHLHIGVSCDINKHLCSTNMQSPTTSCGDQRCSEVGWRLFCHATIV